MINGASIDLGRDLRPSRVNRFKISRFSHVYAIVDSESRYLKFGHASDPRHRLYVMQVATPLDLSLLAYVQVPGVQEAFKVENLVHMAAGRFHIRGEWFAASPRTLMIAEWMKLGTDKFYSLIEQAAKSEYRSVANPDGQRIKRQNEVPITNRES
jgi:hypothetical protein